MQKDIETSLNFANANRLLLAAGFKKPQCSRDLFCGVCRKTIYSDVNRFETIYVNEQSLKFELLCSECGEKYFKTH